MPDDQPYYAVRRSYTRTFELFIRSSFETITMRALTLCTSDARHGSEENAKDTELAMANKELERSRQRERQLLVQMEQLQSAFAEQERRLEEESRKHRDTDRQKFQELTKQPGDASEMEAKDFSPTELRITGRLQQ